MQLPLGKDEFWRNMVRKRNWDFFLLLECFGNKNICPISFLVKIFK